MTDEFRGACLCGAIQIYASGEPEGGAACHCASCRRHTGAPVAVFADYTVARVTFTGNPATFASSPGVRRGFCGSCGSTLFFQGDNLPDMIHLHTGLFDDPAHFQPQAEENSATQMPWIRVETA